MNKNFLLPVRENENIYLLHTGDNKNEYYKIEENGSNWKCQYEIVLGQKHFITKVFGSAKDTTIKKAKKEAYKQLRESTLNLRVNKIKNVY